MRSLVRGAAVLVVLFAVLGLGSTAAGLSPYDILIVNDGHMLKNTPLQEGGSLDRHYASIYKQDILAGVSNANIDFVNTSALGYGPSRETMNDYDLVIWYTLGDLGDNPTCPATGTLIDNDEACTTLFGDEDNPMTGGGDIENVTKYIREDRGRILFTGHQISSELKNSEFLHQVLASNWTSNSLLFKDCSGEGTECGGSTRKNQMPILSRGQVVGPVVDSSTYFSYLNTTSEPADWRDVIYETVGDDGDGEGDAHVRENMYWREFTENGWSDTMPGIDFDDDGVAEELAHSMIRVANHSSKLLNFGIGLESLLNTDNRRNVIRRGINFLLGPRADNTEVHDERVLSTVGEAGFFDADGTWQNVSFANSYNTPVVVGTPNSYNGGQETLVFMARNVHSTWAEMRVCETNTNDIDDGCDPHAVEEAAYMVVDASKTGRIPGVEAGRFRVGDGFDTAARTIQYNETWGADPVLLGSVQTASGEVPIEAVFTDQGTSFRGGICHLASNDDADTCETPHTNETVGWMAFDPSSLPFTGPAAAGRQEIATATWTNFDYGTAVTSFDLDDSFEDGSFTDGSPALWSWNGDGLAEASDRCGANEGSRALVITGADSSGTAIVNSTSYDLSGRSYVRVSYDVLQGFDGGDGCEDPGGTSGDTEDLYVEYYTAGGTWAELSVHQSDGNDPSTGNWEEYIFDLPSDALHSNFKLRFRAPPGFGDTGDDHWAVDDVEIGDRSAAFSELQTHNDGEQLISTRSIGAPDEMRTKFCESDGGGGCDSHAAETVGWAAVPAGSLQAYLHDYPAYTNNVADVESICRNFQVNPRTAIRNAKFFVEGTTGIPANHRATQAGDGTNMTIQPIQGIDWYQQATYSGYDAATRLSNTQPRGVNNTFAIQCQDSNDPFNYWGPFEKDWLVADFEPPLPPRSIEFGEKYTGTPEHEITVRNTGELNVPVERRADLVRFSCQTDGPWTGWRNYNYTRDAETYTFDLTAPLNGCKDTDRNVTVYAQVRDYANNTASQLTSDWIVLDRVDPTFHSLEPQNRYVNLSTMLRINGTDNIGLSLGTDAPASTFFNGTTNGTFTANVSFDPGYGFSNAPTNLTYTWYDTTGWYNDNGHPTTTAEFNEFFRSSNNGVTFGGSGPHTRRIYWHTNNWDAKPSYLPQEEYSWKVEGSIYAPSDGTYTFAIDSDDASDLWIDGDQVVAWIGSGGGHGIANAWTHTGTVQLNEGWHSFTARLEEGTGSDGIGVAWQQPSDSSFHVIGSEYFTSSSRKVLTSWLYDKASNFALNMFDIIVDVRKPSIDSIKENNSYLSPDDELLVNVSDDRSFSTMRLDNGVATSSFTSTDVVYDPGWSAEEWKNLTVRLNDSAGNTLLRRYWYFIDSTPPVIDSISDANGSYINDSVLTVTASDARAGLARLVQYNGNRNESFTSGNGFDADWTGEGTKPLTLFLFDAAGNLLTEYYEFTLDTTDPTASINYTWPPSGDVDGWVARDVAVSIDVTDNFDPNITSYCVGASTCTPDQHVQGSTETTVSCSPGSTCVRYVRFTANDSAGNIDPTTTSDNISIDKQLEEITFESPSDGGEASGVVSLQTVIDDSSGVGLQDVNYSLVNKSTGNVFRSGDLNASNGWDTTWNSSKDVPVTQEITFNVTATDRLGNTRSKNITFRVSNAATTNTIISPVAAYVPANFDLLITAKRAGLPHLVNHTYTIFHKASTTVVDGEQATGMSVSEHSFNFTADTGSWANDGNYTINTTAWGSDTPPSSAFATTWFYLDRVDPQADVSGITNRSWQRGIIDVGYTALDAVRNGSCYWRFRDEGTWSDNSSLSCGSGTFAFDTKSCNDDNTADCRVQLIAEDAAGNIQRDGVSIKVDNSAPTVSFVAPPQASWQDGDFEVKRSDADTTVARSLLTCQWRNGTGNWIDVSGSCDGNFTVDVSTYCSQEGDAECEVEIRTLNPAGWTVRETRWFSIDTRPPTVSSVTPHPSDASIINGSQNITVSFSDPTPGSGIQYAVRNNGTERQSLISGTEFDPGWEDNGKETLSIALNDSADNLVTRQYTYTIDVSPPNVTDPRFDVPFDQGFGEYRVYPGQDVRFLINVSENNLVSSITATLNTSSNPVTGENISLSRYQGQSGVWSFEYTDTDAVGLYNITALFMEDAVQNRNATHAVPSFRVVRYGLNATLDGDRRIAAGHREQVTLDMALNRTLTAPSVTVFVPPSRQGSLVSPSFDNTSAFTCSFAGSSCSVNVSRVDGEVASVTMTGTGSASTMRITADVEASTPSFDTGRRWRTRINGFARRNETTIRAPDIEVTSVGCQGAGICRTNQSEPVNLSVTVANFNTSSNTGVANDTAVNVTNTSLGMDLEALTGDIPTGNTSSTNVSLSVSEAGNFTLDVVAFDRFTGVYEDTVQVDLHVLDTTPPNATGLTVQTRKVYTNDTVPIEVDAMDNIGVGAINVTLRNATGNLTNASMARVSGSAADGTWRADFNRTSDIGFYNLTKLFVYDTYGNINVTNATGSFEVGRLSTTIDASPQSASIDENVVIGVNVSGNITQTTSVVANITKPRSYVETVEVQRAPAQESEYAVVYGNTSRSGSYDVNVSVTAGVTVSNRSRGLFAVDFGQLAAGPLSGNGTHLTLPLDASPYQLSWSIRPDTGDLIDVWANASVNNTSVVELQDSTPGRFVGNVTYEEGDARVTYGLNGREVGSTVFNLSVNASNGDQRMYMPLNVTVVGEDTQAPNITSFAESPTELNKNQPVTITAEVTDNSIVKNMTLVVQHPVNGSNYTEAPVAMEQVDRGTYRYKFTNTSEAGHYTYRIRSWDIALNNDTIHSNSFDVRQQYQVTVTSVRDLFKKSDTGRFTITVRDVNGDVIEGYDTTVVMDKAGSNATLFNDGFKQLLTYTFKRSDPPSPTASEVPQEYTLYINVSKEGNTGATSYSFDVTRLLDVGFIDPNQGDTVAPGSEFQLRVNITGPNGEVVEGIMYARCEQCPSQYRFLDFAGGGLFVQNFTAPQNEDSALIRVFASDLQGNTESQDSGPLSAAPAITIQVGNETAAGPGGGTGGGGGGGGFGTRFQIEKQSPQQVSLPSNTSAVNLSVSTNLAADCLYTNRSLSIVRVDAMNRFNATGGTLHWSVVSAQPGRTYRYNILCEQSTGGNATLEVVFSIEPETVASFGLFIPSTLPPDDSGVEQGSVGGAPFSIYNNGSESIQIEVDAVVRQCCSAWISNESGRVDTVTLTPGSEKSLTLNVDVPLNTSLGTYTPRLSFASGGRVREKTLRMTVVKGQGIKRLESLKQRAQQILQQIQNYRRSGINTTGLRQDYQRLQQLIGYAEQAIEQDDRQVFANVLDQADTKADEIEGRLRALAFKNYVLENWWKWLFGGTAIYTLFFLLTMVVVPYYRLRTDYLTVKEKLESATQARKKAERQYFKRQIDRDTFMDIMTERQDEILELRSERDELEEKLDTALQRRLTLENYLKAPIKAVREINRWIESRRNKMVAEHESSE